jgi:cyclophilin family peptidyl-prolyl cis-trans isomerase/HEAT repeat protein
MRDRALAIALALIPIAGSADLAGEPPPETPRAIQGALLAIELAEARGGPEDARPILDGLRNPEAGVRARAARAAGRWGAERWGRAPSRGAGSAAGSGVDPARDPLFLLQEVARGDADGKARVEAIFALGQIGDLASAADLSALTLDPVPVIRARALEALAKLPGASPAPIVRFLADPFPEVRGAAALALARILGPAAGSRGGEIAPGEGEGPLAALFAERLVQEVEATVRWKLAYLASRRPELLLRPEVRSRLLLAPGSPNFLEAAFAAAALAAPRVPRDAPLAEALENAAASPAQFWIARVECVRAISTLEATGPGPGDGLLRLAESPGFPGQIHHLRRAVLSGLGRPGGDRATALLLKVIEGGDGGDLEAAIGASGGQPELLAAAAKRLERSGGDRQDRLRAALAAARCQAGDPSAFLGDPSPRVRAAAVEAAGHPSKEAMARALADPAVAVRGAAAERIAAGEADVESEDLARAYRESRAADFWEVRAALVTALARKGDLPALRAAANDPHPTVARRAREALVKAGETPPAADAPLPDRSSPASPEFFDSRRAGLSRNPRAFIDVRGRGEVRFDLLLDEAPQTVAAFVRLARKGFYDGLTFHRVVSNWVVQGGDPQGTGFGDAGFRLRDETGPEPFLRGSVGIAKLDRDDGSCQFFITHLPAPRLDGRYTLFARVIEGMEVVDRIEAGDVIGSIRIEGWKDRL